MVLAPWGWRVGRARAPLRPVPEILGRLESLCIPGDGIQVPGDRIHSVNINQSYAVINKT